MVKKLLYLVMIPLIASGMDKPKDARQIAKEIVHLKKRKAIEAEEKKVTEFLQLPSQPECMNETVFDKIAQICTPENVPLMKQLIERGTIKVNAYKEIYGTRCTLLAVSINNAIKNNADFEMAELLLKKGANVESETLQHETSPYAYEYNNICITPLARATSIPLEYPTRARTDQLIPLMRLLLQYKADINRKSQEGIPEDGHYPKPTGTTPFMNIVQKYVARDKDKKLQAPFYELIKECLEHYGASVDIESDIYCSRLVYTPLQYVKDKQAAELIKLFEEHQKKGNNA